VASLVCFADDHFETLPKTFNNHLGFERGLWQRQLGCFLHVPKTTGFVTSCASGLNMQDNSPSGFGRNTMISIEFPKIPRK
jgi:hypothetical protein